SSRRDSEDPGRGRADGQELAGKGGAVVEYFDKGDAGGRFVRQLVVDLEVPVVHADEKERRENPVYTNRDIPELRRQGRAAGRRADAGSRRGPGTKSREELPRAGGR